MINFLLNQTQVSLEPTADQTVLEYLRDGCNRRGTKEGCASGDCGACTVVLAYLDPVDRTALRYHSINACITFVGALHGTQLLTVEDLQHQDRLHPVQQALVDLHGSQCGFCTPGFVMSMFAMLKSVVTGTEMSPLVDGTTGPTGRHWLPLIERYLGGNLCRCTGYRPIIDACIKVLEELPSDQFDDGMEETVQQLQSIGEAVLGDSPEEVSDERFGQFFLPTTLPALDRLLAEHKDARVLAGGTDLALEVTQLLKPIRSIICVKDVPALAVLELTEDSCRIGAGVSLDTCRRRLADLFPELEHLLQRFGSTQIRNQGTVGGNIANASPIGDLPPVFLALDAVLELRCAGGQRDMPIEDFFLAYRQTALQAGEYIQAVRIDGLRRFGGASPKALLKIYKISKRLDDDISAVCAAFKLEMKDATIQSARVAFGGMAAIPRRAPEVEQVLTGKILTPALIKAAKIAISADFQPIDDARASASYRLEVAANLLDRLYIEIVTPEHLAQVNDYVG